MKEILTWGDDFAAQLDRLGIVAKQTYVGAGTVPSVYEVEDADFDRLCSDPEENWEEIDAAWRYAEGCNLSRIYLESGWISVAHRFMKAWRSWPAGPLPKYQSLLQYMEYAIGATQPRNVAAIAAGLADMNLCSIGELFTRYQPAAVQERS